MCLSLDEVEQRPCQHGIGHGLLQYLGHAQLTQVLDVCEVTKRFDPISGCPSGVFMEYNLPVKEDENGDFFADKRPFTAEDPYAPCTLVKEEFRLSCYHELGQWLVDIHDRDYAQAASLCDAIPNPVFAESCLIKVGITVADQEHNSPENIIRDCMTIPENRGKEFCIQGAAQSLAWNDDTRDLAFLVCAALPESSTIRCP
jgi:hypothetical protein